MKVKETGPVTETAKVEKKIQIKNIGFDTEIDFENGSIVLVTKGVSEYPETILEHPKTKLMIQNKKFIVRGVA